MTLTELIQFMQAKLAALNSARASAAAVGDLDQAINLDVQITETQITLNQLKALQ